MDSVEESRQASRRPSSATSREVEVREGGRSSRAHMVRLKVLKVLRAAASVLDVYDRLVITERELRCQLAERLKSFLPPF